MILAVSNEDARKDANLARPGSMIRRNSSTSMGLVTLTSSSPYLGSAVGARLARAGFRSPA